MEGIVKKHEPEVDASGASDVGLVRQDNQDAIRLPDREHAGERGWLYAIADGMGGYANGRMASTLALEKLYAAFYEEPGRPVPQALRRGIESANLDIYKAAQQMGAGRMGTTVTAACLVGSTLHLAHVGDSRAYRIHQGHAACLTNDHTTVGDLVRMKVISPDKIRTHAQRSVLTKAVGLGLFVQPDVTTHTIDEGDDLVLCSDGVWSVIEDDEFAALASRTRSAHELSRALIDLALARETDDNVSAIAIHIHHLSPAPARSRRIFSLAQWFSRRQDPILCVGTR
ncbi:MAG: protein phosphatase 2C domain-containing protein [Anaerolineae bacterium]